ncbi:MAG TPA: DUF58 domain-containing protein [Jiangellaceae bacterium]
MRPSSTKGVLPPDPVRTARATRWRPTWTQRRAAVLLVFIVAVSLVAGTPNVALLALPLAVGSALAWNSNAGQPDVELRVEFARMAEQALPSDVAMTVSGLDRAEMAVIGLPSGMLDGRPRTLVLGPQHDAETVGVRLNTAQWGIHEYGAAGLRVASGDGLFATDIERTRVPPMRVLPSAQVLAAAELPARSAGQVGAHRTRRPGDGSELLDVREFRPGDRIRRIDWRVSARRGELHVRHTAIDADAELTICIDSRHDLGPVVADWPERVHGVAESETSSLDIAVTAAVTLATTYTRLGDRVGFVDLAVARRAIHPGSGRRQLMRIRWQLAGMTTGGSLSMRSFDEATLPRGAVTVVLSPFMDDQVTELVGRLAGTRRDTIAVDVLPKPELPSERHERAAARLVLAERSARLSWLARRGVLVTRWDPALFGALIRERQRQRHRHRRVA